MYIKGKIGTNSCQTPYSTHQVWEQICDQIRCLKATMSPRPSPPINTPTRQSSLHDGRVSTCQKNIRGLLTEGNGNPLTFPLAMPDVERARSESKKWECSEPVAGPWLTGWLAARKIYSPSFLYTIHPLLHPSPHHPHVGVCLCVCMYVYPLQYPPPSLSYWIISRTLL